MEPSRQRSACLTNRREFTAAVKSLRSTCGKLPEGMQKSEGKYRFLTHDSLGNTELYSDLPEALISTENSAVLYAEVNG